MKRKDLMLIIGAAFIAAIFGWILSSFLFGSPAKNPVRVPVVQPITASFPDVSSDGNYKAIFNKNADNPTQLIRIGGQTNPQPFRGQ